MMYLFELHIPKRPVPYVPVPDLLFHDVPVSELHMPERPVPDVPVPELYVPDVPVPYPCSRCPCS